MQHPSAFNRSDPAWAQVLRNVPAGFAGVARGQGIGAFASVAPRSWKLHLLSAERKTENWRILAKIMDFNGLVLGKICTKPWVLYHAELGYILVLTMLTTLMGHGVSELLILSGIYAVFTGLTRL